MKKVWLMAAVFAVVVNFAPAQQNSALPRLAVVEFSTNLSTEKVRTDAITVRNLTESQMVSTGKYQVIAREEIDKLLANQRIQVSSISSTENVKKLQLQNISYIVTGSVDAMGSDYAVTVKILDVGTGQFSHSANDFMGGSSRELYTGITALTSRFVAGMSSSEGQVVQAAAGSRAVSYKVGDTGPGGGTVFYIEGSEGFEVSRLLGSYNWDDAKKAARAYRGGGKDDWYLPTQSELNLIYQNLHKTGKLNMGDDRYWSSSENDYSKSLSWNQRFSDGYQDYIGKNLTYSVRAVRAF
jgi:TolB-like protein